MQTIQPDRRSLGAITSRGAIAFQPDSYGLPPSATNAFGVRDYIRYSDESTSVGWKRLPPHTDIADVRRKLPDTPATIALSQLGDLQDSHCRYIRSLKRAETLLDVLLAPYVRAAIEQDYAPPKPYPKPHWSVWLNDGKPSQAVTQAEAEAAPRKPKRRRKLPRKPSAPLCGPHPHDCKGDSLDAMRYFVASDYPHRCAQANKARHKGQTLQEWLAYADSRNLAQAEAAPRDDDSASSLERHWSEVVSCARSGLDVLPESLPLPKPQGSYHAEAAPVEPLPIVGLSEADQLVAAMIADGASYRAIVELVGRKWNPASRKWLESSIERIREAAKSIRTTQSEAEATPPTYRRAIQAEAVAQLRR